MSKAPALPRANVRIVHAWDRALSGLGIAMRRLTFLPALLLIGAAPVDRIEQLRLGYQLADWARQAGDADAMLAAARVVAASGARAGRISGNALLPADDAVATPAATLADEAMRMAPGDARIAAAAAAVRDSVARGFV